MLQEMPSLINSSTVLNLKLDKLGIEVPVSSHRTPLLSSQRQDIHRWRTSQGPLVTKCNKMKNLSVFSKSSSMVAKTFNSSEYTMAKFQKKLSKISARNSMWARTQSISFWVEFTSKSKCECLFDPYLNKWLITCEIHTQV